MKHAGQQRAKSLALHGLGSSERKRAERAPVKAAMKCDDFVAPRVISRQLDGRLDGLRARIAEINFFRLPCREQFQTSRSRQFHQPLVIKIGAGNMNQFRGLLLNGLDHARMAMPRRNHGDARGKIQKQIAIHVLNHRATPALGHERVAARVGRRNELRVPRDHFLCIRTRKRRQQEWEFGVDQL